MIKDSVVAIKVDNLHKSFSYNHDKSTSIKSKFVKPFKKNKTDLQKVLKGISFEIKKGEFFGIVGKNGSGKSTLLKILAGIYAQDQGKVEVNGKLVPFIELGVGFNPELSGRDNVFLNGALLGFSRKEMASMYEEIVDFAELHDHMEKKLKNYSSGMQVRLAFSIAIRAKGDILVLDEVLAVGDEAFQRKCYTYFSELKRENKTVILVTHSMDSVQRFCDRAILIDQGKIVVGGNPSLVAGKYEDINITNNSVATSSAEDEANKKTHTKLKVKIIDSNISIEVSLRPFIDINNSAVTIMINNSNGSMVYRWASDEAIGGPINIKKNEPIKMKLTLDNIFPDGTYDIQLAIKSVDRSIIHALYNRICIFQIFNKDPKKRNLSWKPKEIFEYV